MNLECLRTSSLDRTSREPHRLYNCEHVISFRRLDVLGYELATLHTVFALRYRYDVVPGCACWCALDYSNANALFVYEVDRCMEDERESRS